MFDIAWNPQTLVGDLVLSESGDLVDDDPLFSAVVLCLFLDKPLPGTDGRDQILSKEEESRSVQVVKWHGDLFDVESYEGDIGSLLWTLYRSKLDGNTLLLAKEYITEALFPLITQKLARGFDVDVELDKPKGMVKARIVALSEQERSFEFSLFPVL